MLEIALIVLAIYAIHLADKKIERWQWRRFYKRATGKEWRG